LEYASNYLKYCDGFYDNNVDNSKFKTQYLAPLDASFERLNSVIEDYNTKSNINVRDCLGT